MYRTIIIACLIAVASYAIAGRLNSTSPAASSELAPLPLPNRTPGAHRNDTSDCRGQCLHELDKCVNKCAATDQACQNRCFAASNACAAQC
jgi:hypothetical protein